MIGHLYTEGVVREDYPEKIKAQIEGLPDNCELIIHHINSPGGNVYAAWKAIPQLMKVGKPILAQVEGEASSIASWLMVAGTFKVQATDPSTFMIHEPFFPEGLIGAIGVDELQGAKNELDQIRVAMAEAYAKKSGKPVDEWLSIMKNKTRMNTKMAKDLGLVDDMIPLEPGRVAAQAIEELKEQILSIKSQIMGLFGKRAVAQNPTAVDVPLNDGKVLVVDAPDGNVLGKKATIDGAPAEGVFTTQDGKQIKCAGGVVTEVVDAPMDANKQIEQLKAQVAQLMNAKAEQEAKIKAEQEAKLAEAKAAEEKAKAEEAVKLLEAEKNKAAALAQEVEKLKEQTVGKMEKPYEGIVPNRQPVGMQKDHNLSVMATRTFLADNLPWLERFYGGKYSDGSTFASYRSGGPNAVSILETNLGYTWNGILSTDIFFKPTLSTPAIADIFTVDLGAADSKRYNIAPVMSKVLKPYTGCGQSVTGSTYDITSKKMQLKPFEMYESFCKDDFTDQLTGSYNLLAQEWLKTGTASFDPAGTPIDRMIVDSLKDALRRDVWRRISFGDTTSSNADYNQIDGLWQSLIDQSGASNYCVYASKTNFGTGALSASAAYNELVAQFKGSSNLLKQVGIDNGKGRFLVTRSVWDNLYDTYTGTGAVTELAFKNAQDGLGQLTFRGIPVIPITIWDDFLADSNNPLSSTTRHLICFTVKENHILGVENTSDLEKIDSWFEKKDNKRYYRANMTMGFLGALHCDLTTVSY